MHLFTVIFSAVEIILPYLYGKIIGAITNEKNSDTLSLFAKFYISLVLGKQSLSWLKSKVTFSHRSTMDAMKLVVFKAVLEKDVEFFDHFKPGEIINRYNDDFYCLKYLDPSRIMELITSITKIIITVISMIYISPALSLIHSILFLFQIYDTLKNAKNTTKYWDPYYKVSDEITNFVTETISNMRLIKAFSTEKKHLTILEEKFKRLHKFYFGGVEDSWEVGKTLREVVEIVELWYGGSAVLQGEMNIGDLTTFQLITKEINYSFYKVVKIIADIHQNVLKCERIFQLIDYEPRLKPSEKGISPYNLGGELEFRNVNFSYPLKPNVNILNNFNLKINKGEVVAIVGSSGSGKSTIASLIQRLYDVDAGEVLIDDINIKDYNMEYLHSRIGYVAQEPSLFADTIENNITYAVNSYTKEQLDEAAMLSNCFEFISDKEQFPDGYSTMLGDKGTNISGGQKQRIAIARALIKDINILIFDEATSALDSNSESEVQAAIDKILKQRSITSIIIAHRLSTVKNCDRIIVMKNGTIVEQGTHKHLLKLDGEYKYLVDKQLESVLSRRGSGITQ